MPAEASLSLTNAFAAGTTHATTRLRTRVDAGWRFALGDIADGFSPVLEDATWRNVVLPHDWSIEGPIAAKNPMGGNSGFFPAGVGWYRQSFDVPGEVLDRHASLEFEGIYQRATIYLNGQKIGYHPYGYTSFHVNLTGTLQAGRNVLAIKVDNSAQCNSRWYSGSGIYRHVWLTLADRVHVDPYGVFVSTPQVSAEKAGVIVQTTLTNAQTRAVDVQLQTLLLSPDGQQVAEGTVRQTLAAGQSLEQRQELTIQSPARWSPESPVLHTAVSRLLVDGVVVDEVTTPFGVRSLSWSAQRGLQINGQSVKLSGGCVHHDNGMLGAAAFDRAEQRRVALLKAAGYNAIRTSHNPPSPAFLEACDRLGMLVMDEAFDNWAVGKTHHDYHEEFNEWAPMDVQAMVLRDRNHPSVIMWSVGNEMNERFEPSGAQIAGMLAGKVRELDRTRPLTLAVCYPWKPGQKWEDGDATFAQVDIAGYNYATHRHWGDVQRVPGRIIVTTESYVRWPFEAWADVADHPYIVGDFVWSAIDYLGEVGIGRWLYEGENEAGHGNDSLYPWHGAVCGDIDITGWVKPIGRYRDIIWNGGDRVSLAVQMPEPEGKQIKMTGWGTWPLMPHWTWSGCEGRSLTVEVYSHCEAVRLLLNGKLLGEKPTTRNEKFRAEFAVPYEPGELKAQALRGGKVVAEDVLRTAGPAKKIRLSVDRATIHADQQDLAYVTVEVTDEHGVVQPHGEFAIAYQLEGPGIIQGIGSGNLKSEEPYQGISCRKTFEGRSVVVIRSSDQAGTIRLKAHAIGLEASEVTIAAR